MSQLLAALGIAPYCGWRSFGFLRENSSQASRCLTTPACKGTPSAFYCSLWFILFAVPWNNCNSGTWKKQSLYDFLPTSSVNIFSSAAPTPSLSPSHFDYHNSLTLHTLPPLLSAHIFPTPPPPPPPIPFSSSLSPYSSANGEDQVSGLYKNGRNV